MKLFFFIESEFYSSVWIVNALYIFAQKCSNCQEITKISKCSGSPEHSAIGNVHRDILLLGIITLQHVIRNNRPYAYDVTEGRPAALGVKRNTATCVIAKHAARGANPASHTAGLARPGPRTERLSANAHCQHNTCALRDTRLASLLWRCDPLWRQCIRSIAGGFIGTLWWYGPFLKIE